MSRHALSRLVLPNLRTLVPIAYRPSPCSCRPAYAAPSLPFLLPQSRSYASKKKGKRSSASTADDDDDDDAPAASQPKGKGVKKGKAQFNTEEDQAANGGDAVVGAFDMKLLEASMDDAVQKLRVALKSVVGRVGRVSPDLLDGVRVDIGDGKKRPLGEFANVSVKDGKDLVVTVYEEDFLKAVSAALYASNLNLTPQATSPTVLRIPIPRPDWDKRQQLVKQASEVCENARVAVRNTRGKGVKEIKSDVDGKIVSKEEARNDTKKLDTVTKKRTDEVDVIFEQAKKLLMDE